MKAEFHVQPSEPYVADGLLLPLNQRQIEPLVAHSDSHVPIFRLEVAAFERFKAPQPSTSLLALREHYKFRSWVDVISIDLVDLYSKIVKVESECLLKQIETERQEKRLQEYWQHLKINFQKYLLSLKNGSH
jgi:hypothetical protein